MLVVDEPGRILYFNQAVTRLLGLQPDVEGQPITRLHAGAGLGKHFALRHAPAARASCGTSSRFIIRARASSAFTPRRSMARPRAVPGVALILHDATEARQKTFEAIESERIQALTLLAASVAHEIGNPLNALHIHLQLMERELKKLKAGRGRRQRMRGARSPGGGGQPTPRKSRTSWSNISTWPEAKSTGWITSSPNFCRRSARRRRNSSRLR